VWLAEPLTAIFNASLCEGHVPIEWKLANVIIIIIITNEKIKVMLSRKRYRGTLQDYKKGEISKCQ